MQHRRIFVFFIIFETVCCGRYSPPSDPREYDFPYTTKVPTVDEMIRDANFANEHHRVITEDGHNLSLNRISPLNPSSDQRGIPVLFVNGYSFHSEGWMGLGRNTSIAFILSDMGYDVWLGDQRGTERSVGHVNYSLSDPRTYQYSFHEMGVYDLPAFIKHILFTTKHDRLFYVGLSLGAGILTIMESEVPEMKDKVIAAVFLGPGIHLTNWKERNFFYYSILKVLDSTIESQIKRGLWLINGNLHLVKGTLASCSFVPFSVYLSSCLNLIDLTIGPSTGNSNPAAIGIQLATVVTSTSVYVAKHLFQVIKTGIFSKYDYGSDNENMKKYGVPSPPKYDLTKVTSPLLVIYSTADRLAHIKAVERSIKDMTSAPLESILLSDFNHVDYLFGRKAPQKVYVPIVDFFDRMRQDDISHLKYE